MCCACWRSLGSMLERVLGVDRSDMPSKSPRPGEKCVLEILLYIPVVQQRSWFVLPVDWRPCSHRQGHCSSNTLSRCYRGG